MKTKFLMLMILVATNIHSQDEFVPVKILSNDEVEELETPEVAAEAASTNIIESKILAPLREKHKDDSATFQIEAKKAVSLYLKDKTIVIEEEDKEVARFEAKCGPGVKEAVVNGILASCLDHAEDDLGEASGPFEGEIFEGEKLKIKGHIPMAMTPHEFLDHQWFVEKREKFLSTRADDYCQQQGYLRAGYYVVDVTYEAGPYSRFIETETDTFVIADMMSPIEVTGMKFSSMPIGEFSLDLTNVGGEHKSNFVSQPELIYQEVPITIFKHITCTNLGQDEFMLSRQSRIEEEMMALESFDDEYDYGFYSEEFYGVGSGRAPANIYDGNLEVDFDFDYSELGEIDEQEFVREFHDGLQDAQHETGETIQQ